MFYCCCYWCYCWFCYCCCCLMFVVVVTFIVVLLMWCPVNVLPLDVVVVIVAVVFIVVVVFVVVVINDHRYTVCPANGKETLWLICSFVRRRRFCRTRHTEMRRRCWWTRRRRCSPSTTRATICFISPSFISSRKAETPFFKPWPNTQNSCRY